MSHARAAIPFLPLPVLSEPCRIQVDGYRVCLPSQHAAPGHGYISLPLLISVFQAGFPPVGNGHVTQTGRMGPGIGDLSPGQPGDEAPANWNGWKMPAFPTGLTERGDET